MCLDKGRAISSKGNICNVAPVLDRSNVKSESSSNYSHMSFPSPSSSSDYQADQIMMRVQIQRDLKSILLFHYSAKDLPFIRGTWSSYLCKMMDLLWLDCPSTQVTLSRICNAILTYFTILPV